VTVAERETFDEFFTAVTGGSWADPTDPHRRVADALRRLSHRSVVYQPDRDHGEWAALADRLESLLDGDDPAAHASRYDPADTYNVDTKEVRPNSRGTHPLMGVANPVSPPLLVGFDDEGVYADVTYDARHEGLFGFVQGGFIAAAFDVMLGQAVAHRGGRGVTASLTVSYRVPTPIGEPLRYRGELERIDGRKAYSRGQLIRVADGLVTAEADALFVMPRQPLYKEN
jgi:acyl-coenzyme A thioesterase PaaI-like protein